MNDRKLYRQAKHLTRGRDSIGVSDIQRCLKVGFSRAHDALMWLARDGVVGEPQSNGRCLCKANKEISGEQSAGLDG